jgi:hypothetical protein
MTEVGSKVWAIPAGRIPPHGSGREPEFTSRDELCVLNAGEEEANLKITIFHTDRDPVGPYQLVVEARRVAHVRFNDLIDPEAIPMNADYAALVESDAPVVVQHVRLDSRRAEDSLFGSIGFAADGG